MQQFVLLLRIAIHYLKLFPKMKINVSVKFTIKKHVKHVHQNLRTIEIL